MKIIHSFWSKPILNNLEKLNNIKLFYELSLDCLKRTYKDVELHTDSFGASLLKDLNYDKVHLSFDDDYMQNLDPLFWASSKIFALKTYEEPVIHFDADFFIFRPEKFQFQEQNFDVIVQSKEISWESNYKNQSKYFKSIMKLPYGDFQYNFAYNCGILGFKNIDFKNHYVHKHFEMVNYAVNYQLIKSLELAEMLLMGQTPFSTFFEQVLLTKLAQDFNLHVKEFVPVIFFDKKTMISSNYLDYFFHAMGNNKWKSEFITAIKKTLETNRINYKSDNIKILINYNRS